MSGGSKQLVDTLVDSEESRQSAVAHLNAQLGKDVSKLSTIEDIVQQLQCTKQSMEEKLQFVSTAAPDQISQAVQAAERGLLEAGRLQKEAGQIQEQYSMLSQRVTSLLGTVRQELELVQQLDRVRCYNSWLRALQQISAGMCQLSGAQHEMELLARYAELQDNLRQVATTACSHLQRYVLDTLNYWHTRLLYTFSQEFEDVLKSMKYPFITTNTSVQQPKIPPDSIARLQTLTKHLLKLHHPPDSIVKVSSNKSSTTPDLANLSLTESSEDDPTTNNTPASTEPCINESIAHCDQYPMTPSRSAKKGDCDAASDTGHTGAVTQPAIVADFTPQVTPLKLLLKPLEVRFAYHFSGNKKTNSTSHPEWCLTRVLNWISDHSGFLACYIQPVLDSCHYGHISAKTEFCRGLVRLVVLKLSQDLSSVISDEDLFCHSLQETLNFEREVRLSCGYPLSQPSVLVVLSQPLVFTQWLHLEKKFAVALMDELVTMSGAWSCDDEDTEGGGGGGVSACGEQLVTLLQGITDRYKPLPQPGHRLQFLEVQLDVLDEFRVRAVQLSRELQQSPVTSHYPAILNTLHQLAGTLADWGDMPFFLELQVYRCQYRALEAALEAGEAHSKESAAAPDNEDVVKGSVFDECVSLYRHVEKEMLATLLDYAMTEIRARFMPYRRDKWFMEHKSGTRCEDVSLSLCPLLEVLARQLHALRRVLTTALFTALWQQLVRDMDKFLFEELVLQNHFSDFGCSQFEYDMTKALFPMFAEFTARPDNHFILVKESVSLLCLPLAPAVLLRDTLRLSLRPHRATEPGLLAPADAALAESGVSSIAPEQALVVLTARNTLSSL